MTLFFSLGQDRKQKLQENNITHVLSIHDNAEPEYTVSHNQLFIIKGVWLIIYHHLQDLFTYKCFKVSDMSSSDL